MADEKVVGIHGGFVAKKGEPREALIYVLERALEKAKSGELQNFIGTGWLEDGNRFTLWCDHHENIYEMLGSLSWLHAEYIRRHEVDEQEVVERDDHT